MGMGFGIGVTSVMVVASLSAPVDQGDGDVIGELAGQPGGQFQTAESGAEDEDAGGHVYSGCGTIRMYGLGCCQPPKISLASSLLTEPISRDRWWHRQTGRSP
jgi:hypothetical protein